MLCRVYLYATSLGLCDKTRLGVEMANTVGISVTMFLLSLVLKTVIVYMNWHPTGVIDRVGKVTVLEVSVSKSKEVVPPA